MKLIAVLAGLAVLAACGVDGPPTRPDKKERSTGIFISGTAEIGITGGSRR